MKISAKRMLRSLAFVTAVAVAFVACGDDDGGTSGSGSGSGAGNGSGNGASTGSSSTFSCCFNGNGYDCPDNDALNDCASGDPSSCSADANACSSDSEIDLDIEASTEG